MLGCQFGAGSGLEDGTSTGDGVKLLFEGGQHRRVIRDLVGGRLTSHHGPASASRIGERVSGSAATASSAAWTSSAGQCRTLTASWIATSRHGAAHRVVG